ncbi:MAG: hypothetical protein ACRCTZ_01580 [Sarcina sp.]
MEQVENWMVLEPSQNKRELVGICEYCDEMLYDDEEYLEFHDMLFCVDCIHDWVDSIAEKH